MNGQALKHSNLNPHERRIAEVCWGRLQALIITWAHAVPDGQNWYAWETVFDYIVDRTHPNLPTRKSITDDPIKIENRRIIMRRLFSTDITAAADEIRDQLMG